jgi:hypothetical protein
MKTFILIIFSFVCLSANAAFYQYNRFTTNADGVLIDGSTLINLSASSLPALGVAYPNALTNNDARAGGAALAEKLTLTPGGGLDPIAFGANSGAAGPYVFAGIWTERATAYQWNNLANTVAYGGIDNVGNFDWGGPTRGSNYFTSPYASMSAGMMTNINPYYDEVAHLYPVPILAFDTYSDMGCTPNGAWPTNTIALLDTVAPNWFKSGWINIIIDCGQLTNRINGHLTNNGAAFPQGVAGIVNYAHSHGFNIGAYVAHANQFCAGNPGLPTTDDLVFQDIYDIGLMGFDLLKVDYCGSGTYQGLVYDPGGTMLPRHYSLFPEANYNMSFRLGRKPLYMETTEVFSSGEAAWHKWNTLAGYNAYENGSPPGANTTWKGTFTNIVFEMPNFHETRPGHYHRLQAFGGTTANEAKGYMTLAALGPCSVWNGTNVIGNAAVSPYFTNPIVNQGVLQHPLVLPGYVVATNAANKTATWARPLGPLNGTPTTANGFNGGGNASSGIIGYTNGYTTFGSALSNAIGVFNFDSSGHTITVTWGQVGIPTNTPIAVYDVWSATPALTFVGMATNAFVTPSIAANDTAFYLFVKPPFSMTNDTISPMSEAFLGQTGAGGGASTFHVQNTGSGPGALLEQTTAPFGNVVGLGFKTFGLGADAILDEGRSANFGNAANSTELQFWFQALSVFSGYFGNVGSGFKTPLGVGGALTATNGIFYAPNCPINTNFTSYASGTAYTLTITPAQLAFGTTSPSITIQNAGTYTIRAGIGVKYVSATYAGAQTITLKLRRTNNTPADLTNGGRTVELPVLTTFTGGDVMTTPEIIYTATAGDIVQIFGSISATPSAGSVQTDSAEIVAVRVF